MKENEGGGQLTSFFFYSFGLEKKLKKKK